MKKLFLLTFSYLLFTFSSYGQMRSIDSLLNLLKTDKPDTNKVIHFNILSREYNNIGYYDSALHYANSALGLSNTLPKVAAATAVNQNILKGEAFSYNCLGNAYSNQGNYPEALKNHFASLKIREAIVDKLGMAASYNNIGTVYSNQGNYPEALKSYFTSLKIRESVGDKKGIAGPYHNIGIIYLKQGNYLEALKIYFASLKIFEASGNKHDAAISCNNIGNVYYKLGNYTEALRNHFASLKISELISDNNGVASSYASIGNVYMIQGNYPEATKNYVYSLKIQETIGNKEGIVFSYNNIGTVLTKQKKYKEAEEYLNKAKVLSQKIGYVENLRDAYYGLSILDSLQSDWKAAYQHHKQYMIFRDSIDNEETKKKTIESSMNYQFDIKEASIKAEQDKKDTIAEANKKRQLLILILVSFVLILVFAFAGLIFRSLRVTRKQKLIIEEKNKLVEEKNKDIIDSIRYAKRIQDALLREEEHVSMHLPEHFILFMPKDIVSGDFYWGTEKQEYWYFAVVDCTGHGVPGAVMSMLGISFLNDIVAQELLNPAEILDRLRDRVVKELRQTGETGGSKDGMDISLARLNLKTFELQWAGANNSLNLIQNGLLGIVKADKQPIGYHTKNQPFTNHEIQLQKGDSIYLYSDGYADQFGGPKGKKLKYKQLDDLIITHKLLKMKDQKELFKKHFIEWKGQLEQVDDVCVFGVRI